MKFRIQDISQKLKFCIQDISQKYISKILQSVHVTYDKWGLMPHYLQKCNIKNTPTCECGEKETISPYFLDCTNYETLREKMRRRLFDCCGIIHLDINILLDAKQEDDFKEWRSLIISEL